MALPLATVLNAAPGLISAAADIIGLIRKNKQRQPQADAAKLEELTNLLEQQAQVLEELALNNRNLVLAVRNNRLVALAAVLLALCAMGFAVFGRG
jgi:hypothetical protein